MLTRSAYLVALLLICFPAKSGPPVVHYSIGTGSKGATFYPVAAALCQLISNAELGFTCGAVESPGSRYNLDGLQRGEFDLALSQVSLQYQAWRGVLPFYTQHKNVRTLAPLHREVFILAVRPGLKVTRLRDLQGRRLNIGNEGSGSRVIIERLLQFLALDQVGFTIHGARSAELPELFCNGEIDAAIYSTGHPNTIYSQLIDECGVELVDLWNEQIAGFVESSWEIETAMIPGNTYIGITGNRYGFGEQVVMSAHREMPPDHVAKILEILKGEKEALAEIAPIYKSIQVDGEQLQRAAPNHRGVEEYFSGGMQ